MLWVKAVADRMAIDLIRHHPTMPSFGETAEAVASTGRLKDGMHASIMSGPPMSGPPLVPTSEGLSKSAIQARERTLYDTASRCC
jgi:hypothetical protein